MELNRVYFVPFKSNFQAGIANARKLGARYLRQEMFWELELNFTINGERLTEETIDEFLRARKLKRVIESSGDSAMNYRGQRSMDDPESIF